MLDLFPRRNPTDVSLYQRMLDNMVAGAPLLPPKLNGSHSTNEDRTISSSKLTLCSFMAYVQGPGNEAKTDLLRIPKMAEESIEVSLF